MTAPIPLRVLGGVEVVGETPGPLLERKLLAILTMRRNRSMPSGQLVDELWNGRPPASAGGSMHSKVSRVRLRLGDSGLELVRSGSGYSLRVPPSGCDLDVFETKATAFIQGGLGAPLTFAEEAFDLWRGRPYGEFADEHWAIAEVTRLELLRESLGTHRVRVLVAMRRFEEALVHGEALHDALAFSDDVCALRMHAFAGLGRYVEALRVYDRFRRHLRDETGVNPGPELAALNDRLLQLSDSPTIDALPATARQRLSTGSYRGRKRLLADAIEQLASVPLMTIVGEGGIGKTRFAAEVTNRVDRVVWCDIELARSEHELLRTLATGVGVHPSEPVEFATLAQRLAVPGTLVVLDGCECGFDLVRRIVVQLRGYAAVRVLATSRRLLDVADEVAVRLRPLPTTSPTSAAVTLLVDRARSVGVVLDPGDPAVRGIAQRLDGHPLAIELVATRLAMLSPSEVVAALDNQIGWSYTLASTGPRRSLLDAVGLSYSTLDRPAQQLFRAMSVFSGPTSVGVIRRLVGRIEAELNIDLDAMTCLIGLANCGLVHVTDDGTGILRYRVLNPLADVGRRLADIDGELDKLRRHHVLVMVELVEAAVAAFPGPDEVAWAATITGELANLRAAHRACTEYGWFDLHTQMIAGLANESRLRERAEVEEWAMELAAHPDIRLSSHAALVLAMSAHAHLMRTRFPQAIRLAIAARQAAVAGAAPTWSADCVLFQTSVMEAIGAVDDRAKTHHRAMYDYTTQTNDPMGAAIADFIYAYVSAEMGRPGEAIAEALHCVRLGRRVKSLTIEAMGVYCLARLRTDPLKSVGRLRHAIRLAEQANCDVLARQAARALLMVSDSGELRPALERFRALAETSQSQQLLQEVSGLLIPLIRAGEAELAATITGALLHTIWWPTVAVRAAEEHLANCLSPGQLSKLRTNGRVWTIADIVDSILRLLPEPPDVDDEDQVS